MSEAKYSLPSPVVDAVLWVFRFLTHIGVHLPMYCVCPCYSAEKVVTRICSLHRLK